MFAYEKAVILHDTKVLLVERLKIVVRQNLHTGNRPDGNS